MRFAPLSSILRRSIPRSGRARERQQLHEGCSFHYNSLGAMIFRTLAGRAPFATSNMLEMYKLATRAERPSLHELRTDLPRDVDLWVGQALAIEPAKRFKTPRASYRAICSVLGIPAA